MSLGVLVLHLCVEERDDWPARLLSGDDTSYNTAVLRAGLASLDTEAQRRETELLAQLHDTQERVKTLESELVAQQSRLHQQSSEREEKLRQEQAQTIKTLQDLLEQQRLREQQVCDNAKKREESLGAQHAAQLDEIKLRVGVLEKEKAGVEDRLLQAYQDGVKEGKEQSQHVDAGKAGEIFVNDLIRKTFPSAVVKDMSNRAGQADAHVLLNDTFILIETKNVKEHRADQVTKFWDDIERIKPDAGLYVSCRDTTSASRSEFTIQMHPKPVIILHDAFRNPSLITAAINFLLVAVAHKRQAVDDKGDGEQRLLKLAADMQQILEGPLSRDIRYFKRISVEMGNKAKNMEECRERMLGLLCTALQKGGSEGPPTKKTKTTTTTTTTTAIQTPVETTQIVMTSTTITSTSTSTRPCIVGGCRNVTSRRLCETHSCAYKDCDKIIRLNSKYCSNKHERAAQKRKKA